MMKNTTFKRMLWKQTTVDKQLTQIKEDVRARIAQIERTPRQQGMVIEYAKNVNFNGEGEY